MKTIPRILIVLLTLCAPALLHGYTELKAQTLQADLNLAAGTYLVTGTLTVPEGRTLTLQPGAVLKFNSYWHRIVVDGGRIVANAANAAPIVFTSQHDSGYGEAIPGAGDPAPDQWGGILLQKANGVGTPAHASFVNCVFRYGGGYGVAMLETQDCPLAVIACRFESSKEMGVNIAGGAVLDGNPPEIRDSVFLNNGRCGIHATRPTVEERLRTVPVIHGCTFDGNGTAMEFYHNVFPDFDGASVLVQRAGVTNGIAWSGSANTSGRLEYPGPAFPYVLTNSYTQGRGTALLIEPGVTVKANSFWHRIYCYGADLQAEGTAELPIHFTSIQDDTVAGDTNGDGSESVPAPDQWGGVLLLPSDDDDALPSSGSFAHAHFRYGGGYGVALLEVTDSVLTASDCSFRNSKERGVNLIGSAAYPADAVFTRCAFTGNGTLGFYIQHTPDAGVSLPVFDACSFNGNGTYAGQLTGNVFPVTGRSNQLTPAAGVNNGVAIGHNISRGGRLDSFGPAFPYVLAGAVSVPYGVTLSIGPGTLIKANSFWHRFSVAGDMVIEGAEGDAVVMTSIQDDAVAGDTNGDGAESAPAPDQWGGIYLHRETEAPVTGSLEATWLEMYYGGGYGSALVESEAGAVSCSDSRFAHSKEYGMLIKENTNPGAVALVRCAFVDNGSRGCEIRHGNEQVRPVVHSCTFSGNAGFAMALIGNVFPDFDGANTIAQGLATGGAGIAIEGTISQGGGTLEFPGDPAPFILSNAYIIRAGSALTIEPGVIVKANSFWHRFHVEGATLTAIGTHDQPIILTVYADDTAAGDSNGDGAASAPAPDQWGGIYANNGGAVHLEHCRLYYGGGYGNALVGADSSTVTITDSILSHSAEYGVYASGTSSVTVRNSILVDNRQHGAAMASSTHMLDARGNYWGDPRGPLDSSDQADLVKAAGHTYHNPDSTGESVSNNVLYDGWLGAIPVWDGYLWSDAADRGDGWRHSSWYGWFNDTLFPHILHTEHGWQYCMGDSQRHMWIYDYALGSWLYVSRDFHPVIYKYGAHAGWYGYYKGGRTPRRWFHHFASGTDFTEANLK